MKTLLPKVVAVVAMAIPLTMATGKPAPKPVPTFGGFAKGYKFTLPVTSKESFAVTHGSTTATPVPVPAGVPNFKVGQQVTFTIGAKGELTGTGFKLPYIAGSGSAVSAGYSTIPTLHNLQPNVGLVIKNASGQGTGVSLTFALVKIKKLIPTITTVSYTFGSL